MRTVAVLTLTALVLVVVSISGCTDSDFSSSYDTGTSASPLQMSAAPFQVIDIPGNFNASLPAYASFYDSDYNNSGYVVDVPTVEVSSDHVSVSVPPYFNYQTGSFTTGNLSVAVFQKYPGHKITYKPKSIHVSDMPTPNTRTGVVTLSYLEAMLNVSKTIKLEGIVDTPEMRVAIATDQSILENLTAAVKELMANPSKKIYLGTMNNNTLLFGIDDLKKTDRMIYAMLVAQAGGEANNAGNGATGMIAFAGGESCMERVAQNWVDALGTDAGPTTSYDMAVAQAGALYGNSPRTSMPCKIATSANTAMKVVAGSGAAAAGLASLGGATMAAAQASSALLYLSTTIGGGLIAIGGVLGQATEDAKQLVIEGVDKMEDSLKTVGLQLASQIKVGAGKWEIEIGKANDIYDVWSGANDVRSAFSEVSTADKSYYVLVVEFPDKRHPGFSVNPGTTSGFGDCSLSCELAYFAGQTVTIAPHDSENLDFDGWSGDCIGMSTCTVTMNRNRHVTMRFKEKEQQPETNQDTGQQSNNQQNNNVPSGDNSATEDKLSGSIDSVSCEPHYAYGTLSGWDFKISGTASGPMGSNVEANVYKGPGKQTRFAFNYNDWLFGCASWTKCHREEGQPAETAWTASFSWGLDSDILGAKFNLGMYTDDWLHATELSTGWSCPGG